MKIYHYFDEFPPEIKNSKIATDPDRICYFYEEKSLFYKLNKEQKKK